MNQTAIAIHGGAGPDSPFIQQHEQQYLSSLAAIVQAGDAVLERGGTALDAVTECVCRLEDNPLFNAGKGAALSRNGQVGMDASIMDGTTLQSGAVAYQQSARHSVALARAVMEHTPYVMLTGDALDILIEERGLETAPASYFITPHQQAQFLEHQKKDNGDTLKDNTDIPLHGTVGAVALDRQGSLAAATSTGGAEYCLPGRISDSCIIGAGCYANNSTCAVSGTGDGEFLIRGVVAYRIAALMELAGYNVSDACTAAIRQFKAGEYDMGVISIDKNGHIGHAFNSARMHRAWIDTTGHLTCAIYR